MYNCKLSEAVITVTQTSRYGQPYDLAHVEAFFQTDAAIPDTDVFLVPSDEPVPPEILGLLKLAKVSFAPIPKSEVIANISDLTQEVNQQQRDAVTSDVALSLAAVYMKAITLKSIGSNSYYLSYDYKLYPDANKDFYIYAKLPFRGFTIPSGGQVRFVVVLPTNAQYDPTVTTGVALNNQVVNETFTNAANGKPIISFFWQNDPDFTVKYRY